MVRLFEFLWYTSLSPESERLPRSKDRQAEVESLGAKYTRLPDDNGVELCDGTKVKLLGPDLGVLIAKCEHNASILDRHNLRLQDETRKQFPLLSAVHLSRLDWAVFKAHESRVLGNFLNSDDFTDEQVARMGNIEPGMSVFKIGRTSGHTDGIVNGVALQIWETGVVTQEVAVISSSGGTDTAEFATGGDSGSLVVRDADPYEAVGLVVGKNELGIPRWVAVTPLWAVVEDVERVIGKEVEFCCE